MSKDEALVLALEFIERTSTYLPTTFDSEGLNIHSTIKAALAAPVQEPVATLIEHYAFTDGIVRFDGVENMEQLPVGTKFFTASPAAQRQWVGLTSQDWNVIGLTSEFRAGAEWANDKLKEKNT